MNWPLFVTCLFAWSVAFAAGVAVGRFRNRRTLVAAAAGFAGLLIGFRILGRLYPGIEFSLLPFDIYVPFRPWWVFAVGLFAAGIGTSQMTTKVARGGLTVFAAMLFVVAFQRLWLTCRMETATFRGRPDPLGLCRQTTDFSCGAAAASTMLAQFGIRASEEEMAVLCGTNAFTGTDEFSVCRGLRAKLAGTGRAPDVIHADWERLRSSPLPAMATVRNQLWVDHWVVVLSFRDDAVAVGDPGAGARVMRRAEFERIWRRVLVVAPPK
jgi:hypothetical protein